MRRMERPRQRSYLSIPSRNVRRALFLVLALLAVVALKRSGGGFFSSVINSFGPPPPARPAVPETTVHLHMKAPPP
jgi:hypothetical protein